MMKRLDNAKKKLIMVNGLSPNKSESSPDRQTVSKEQEEENRYRMSVKIYVLISCIVHY